MPQYTPKYTLPYPTMAEAPNGPAQIQALATVVDDALYNGSIQAGLSSARPPHRDGKLFFETDTNRVVISTGGSWVTFKSLYTPHARMSRTTTQSIPSGAATKVTYTSADYDSNPALTSIATGDLTIRESGLYQVTAQLVWTSASTTGSRTLQLIAAGSQVAANRVLPESGVTYVPLTYTAKFAANTVLSVNALQSAGTAQTITSGSYLAATWLAL